MKKAILPVTLAALIAATLFSCKSSNENLLPPCTGKPGEVLLIIADDLYKGAAGDTLVAILTREEPALPRTGMEGAEAMFDLLHLPPSALNNTIRPARNMVIVDVDPALPTAEMKVFKDYWADEQILIRINARDRDELITLLNNSGSELIRVLREGEVDRQTAYNRKYRNQEITDKLFRNHEFVAYFPKEFTIRVDTGNFVWVQSDVADMTQGVFFWSYPYTSEKQLELPELQAFTDQHLMPRVPGPSGPKKPSYMQLVREIPVTTRTFTHNGHFVREMRGLWEVKLDFMGGPFISWTFVDEARNRLVTAFGFVYAPKLDKRNQIRKVEGMLKTVEFPAQSR